MTTVILSVAKDLAFVAMQTRVVAQGHLGQLAATLRMTLLIAFLIPAPVSAAVPGDRAPEIVGRSMDDGREVRLSDLRGKVVYLDFWASWCAPCKISMPRLQQMQEELSPLGFEVVGVNVDDDAALAREAARAGEVHYTMLRGVDAKTIAAYEIIKMPGAYLIDRDGVIRYSYQGFSERGFADVKPIVERLVKTGKAPDL
jgi:thiol-disulfide isomerase/thioredoxin